MTETPIAPCRTHQREHCPDCQGTGRPIENYNFRDELGHPLENCVEYQEILRLANLGAALDASSNPTQEISPINDNVPIDDAVGTIKHLVYLGSKPFFNAQRISDCIATVEKKARLGAAVEAKVKDAAWYDRNQKIRFRSDEVDLDELNALMQGIADLVLKP